MAARLTIPLCRARNASSRCEALGTRSASPSKDRVNPPSTLTMNVSCDPGRDPYPGMIPSRQLEADDLPQESKVWNDPDRGQYLQTPFLAEVTKST
jgi:hypothetical protein